MFDVRSFSCRSFLAGFFPALRYTPRIFFKQEYQPIQINLKLYQTISNLTHPNLTSPNQSLLSQTYSNEKTPNQTKPNLT